MDLVLQKAAKRRRVSSAQSSDKHVLDLSYSKTTKQNILSLSKWEEDSEGAVRLSDPLCRWSKIKNEGLGSCAVLDSRKGLVFASLKDCRRFVSLQVPEGFKHGLVDESARELEIKSPLFSFSSVPGVAGAEDGDLVVAVSETGELVMICATGTTSEIQTTVLPSLPVDSVLAVSYFTGGLFVVAGLQKSNIMMFPLHFVAGAHFCDVAVDCVGAIQLPRPKLPSDTMGKRFILDFAFDERYIIVLYAGGVVNILHPELDRVGFGLNGDKLGTGHKDRQRSAADGILIHSKLDHAFRLSSGAEETVFPDLASSTETQGDTGGIARLDESYVAIGYGQCISVWDLAYHIGHGFVRLDNRVTLVCPGHSRGKVLIGSEAGLEELGVQDVESSVPFSLGLAVSRKGTCDCIATDLQRASETVPMRSQPVTVAVAKIAAEAENDPDLVFRQKLGLLDDLELVMVRKLLNRSETGSPEAVSRLTESYTTHFGKVRRGNRGDYVDMGLAELPSERLAAVSVARCLYEIHFGKPKFLVPLIDMIGTGVVSSEAVLAVMGSSDSWSMGPDSEPLALLSIVDPLLTSGSFMNVLEAMVTRVADLPEPDIVRVIQFVVRLSHDEFSRSIKSQEVSESEGGIGESDLLSQSTHLILKCVNSAVDNKRVVASLQQIPIADVMRILDRFDHILRAAASANEVKKISQIPRAFRAIRDGFFLKPSSFFNEAQVAGYRGVGDWMDDDHKRKALGSKSVVSGCIAWTSHMIDAHLANLIMDETGQELAGRLLETVRARRGEFEAMKSLHGLTSHLLDKKPVPSQKDPLYTNMLIEVPAYASLQ